MSNLFSHLGIPPCWYSPLGSYPIQKTRLEIPVKIKQDFPTSYLGEGKRRSWGLDLSFSASVIPRQAGLPRTRMSTPGDRRILNSVVNPLLPIGEAVYDDQEEEEQQQQVGKGFNKNCSRSFKALLNEYRHC